MVELVNEGTEAHAIAEQHEFVLELRALLTSACEELDCSRPLSMRQPRLASKGVQMIDERREDLCGARILAELAMQLVDTVLNDQVAVNTYKYE